MKIDYKTKISVKFANGNSMALCKSINKHWHLERQIKTQRFHI